MGHGLSNYKQDLTTHYGSGLLLLRRVGAFWSHGCYVR